MTNEKNFCDYSPDEFADLDQLQYMAENDIAGVPPPGFLAFFVRFQRRIMGWKQGTLADFSGVSLSTIQRVERGETASTKSLDQIAVALGYNQGDFTEPRVPLKDGEAAAFLKRCLKPYADRVAVPVRPIRTIPQIGDLARTHCYLVDGGRIDDAHEEDISVLIEHLDFAAFVISTGKESIVKRHRRKNISRREIYRTILNQVREIERRGRAVALAGIYEAKTSTRLLPEAKVGLIAFFPKDSDPAAIKRQFLLAPAEVDLRRALGRDLN